MSWTIPEIAAELGVATIVEGGVQRSGNSVRVNVQLDPSLPEVRSTEAWYQLTRNYDWSGAETIFRESLEAFPDNTNLLHWMSHTLSWQGRQTEGLVFARRALEVEPDSRLMLMNLAYILADAGDYPAALQTIRQIRDDMPDYYAARRTSTCTNYEQARSKVQQTRSSPLQRSLAAIRQRHGQSVICLSRMRVTVLSVTSPMS